LAFPAPRQDGLQQASAADIRLLRQTNATRCAVHREQRAAQLIRVGVDERVQGRRSRLPELDRRAKVAEQHDGTGFAHVIHLLLDPELGGALHET
jgi:hypothetical protein